MNGIVKVYYGLPASGEDIAGAAARAAARAAEEAAGPAADRAVSEAQPRIEEAVEAAASRAADQAVARVAGEAQAVIAGAAQQAAEAAVAEAGAQIDARAQEAASAATALLVERVEALEQTPAPAVLTGLRVVDGVLYADMSDGTSLQAALPAGGAPPQEIAPVFTEAPSLIGSTALGSTITVSLGAASGTPAPALTGTLTRPGKAAAAVLDGATFTVEAADQGGTITLDVTATNAAGSATASAALEVPAAGPPTVQNVTDGGYIGTTASITPEGEVTITNVSTFLSEADLQVFHYLVRADNMYGKTLTVKRATGNPNQNGGRLTEWQMAWAYDPHGAWFPFDNLAVVNSMVVASNNAPCTQGSVYIARRPVFTNTRWDAAIARWKASPHTSPTASGNADFVVGTLPSNQYAPAMPVHGFKFGTGSTPFVLTGNVHTGEHIGAYAMEGMVDWLLGDSPDAVWLRSFCTFYVYPKLNPQGRYAGSGRCEPVGGNTTNSNRIWYPPSANSNIPLSAVMVAAWQADIPNGIGGYMDFHDTGSNPGRGFIFSTRADDYITHLQAQYQARTGLSATVEPSTASLTIGSYLSGFHGALFGMAVEHDQSPDVGIAEWRLWGVDQGIALRNYYGAVGAPVLKPVEWVAPTWLPFTAITVTENNGALTFTRDGNPGAAFLIPEGKTIEVIFDATMVSAETFYVRHSEVPTLGLSQSDDLAAITGRPTKHAAVYQVAWTPTRQYFGFISAKRTTVTTASVTLKSAVKYRVLP